jgi:hypothetical protein
LLVSHTRNFIYTKTKKTAGTSVESYFEPFCLPEGAWSFSHAREETVCNEGIIGFRGSQSGNKTWWHHMPAALIRQQLGPETWNRYFKFCVIRDPFDKLVSAFHFFVRQGPSAPVSGENPDTRKRVLIKAFREWLKTGEVLTDRETYTLDGRICMDYVIRFESLKEGIQAVCDRLGLVFEPNRIPVLKAGSRQTGITIADYYDKQSIDRVENAYRMELDYFGYKSPKQ